MFFGDYVLAARHGDEHVAQRSGLPHAHDRESVHDRLHRLYRVNFSHYHLGAQAFRPHGHALSAPAVAGHDNIFPGHNKVGGAVDSVPDGLPRAVTVVEEVLACRIVYEHHRELKTLGGIHLPEPEYACRGLLAASDDIGNQFRKVLVNHGHEISAVIDDDVRTGLDDTPDASLIFLGSRPMDCKDIEPFMDEGRSDIVLSRERIASGDEHLSSSLGKDLAQMRRLRLKMDGQGYLQPRERLRFPEILFDSFQQRHVLTHPLYLHLSALPDLRIPDFT